jgi:signal transduction histidine kinase
MPDKNEQLANRLDKIGTFAKDTIQELRDTIWAMNKSGVTINDLQSRIVNFIEKARHSSPNVAVSLKTGETISAAAKFTSLQGLNIFRIIQEATNNALKYAEAGQIRIQINKYENSILFTIEDDGKGFQEKNVEPGNGLLNMRKRAFELGSELALISEPGNGTSVAFKVS